MNLALLLCGALLAALAAVFVGFHQIGPVWPLMLLFGASVYLALGAAHRRGLIFTAFTLVIVLPGYAFAASIDIGQALTGSLQDIINGAVTAAIAALVGWVAIVVKNKFNIDIEARHREALTAFLQRQASGLVAMGAVKLSGVKVEVQNQALADAANAALRSIPAAMGFFGLTPEKVQSMIVDLIPKQPTVAAAQAVAMDVANPATPSKPA